MTQLTPEDRELLDIARSYGPATATFPAGPDRPFDAFDLYDVGFAHCSYSNQPMPPVLEPKYLRWVRGGGAVSTTTSFVTDTVIPDFSDVPGKRTVAWLLEPRALNGALYDWVAKNAGRFYAILSHDVDFFASPQVANAPPGFIPYGRGVSNFLWVPFGGCWVPRDKWWDCKRERNKQMGWNIIASSKRITQGHNLRHEIIQEADDRQIRLVSQGGGYSPFDTVDQAMGHQYQVVVENDRRNGYFTEKLINCFASGVVPIYWGCPDLAKYGFDERGVMRFDSSKHLFDQVLPRATPLDQTYSMRDEVTKEEMYAARVHNFKVATERYLLAEDYIYDNYKELFR